MNRNDLDGLGCRGKTAVLNGMGLGACHLAANPDMQAQLRANPAMIVETSEEIIRRYTFTITLR